MKSLINPNPFASLKKVTTPVLNKSSTLVSCSAPVCTWSCLKIFFLGIKRLRRNVPIVIKISHHFFPRFSFLTYSFLFPFHETFPEIYSSFYFFSYKRLSFAAFKTEQIIRGKKTNWKMFLVFIRALVY